MITQIRKIVKGRVVKVFSLVMLAALGGLFSLPALFQQLSTGLWVAKVNDRVIPYNLFTVNENVQKNRINYFRQQYGKYADLLFQAQGKSLDSRELALQELTNQELMNQLASDLDIHLSDEFIKNNLSNPLFVYQELFDFVPHYAFDEKTGIKNSLFKKHLKNIGFSVQEFELYVEKLLQRKAALQMIVGSVYVPDFIVKQHYSKQYLARKFSVALFDFNTYLQAAKLEKIADKEVEDFYNQQNKKHKKYLVAEKRAGKVWEFDPLNYNVQVDTDRIQAHYNANKYKKFVKTPAMVQVRKILFAAKPADSSDVLKKAEQIRLELLKNPTLFAEKAKELSSDKDSAKNGGLMPEFSRGTHEYSLDRASFVLKKDGDISKVIKVEKGFALVQRVKKTVATVRPLVEVQDQIKEEIIKKNFSKMFYKDMQKAVVSNKLVDSSVLKRSKKVTSIALQGNKQDELSRSLFRTKEEEFTFYIKDNKGYLVTTSEIIKRHLPTFDVIKDQVLKDLYEVKAAKALARDLKKAKQMVASGTTFLDLKKQFTIMIDETSFLKKSDTPNIDSYRKKGYPVDRMMNLEKAGSLDSYQSEFDGYLIQVSQVEKFNQKEYKEKYTEMKKRLQSEYAGQLVSSFIASLVENATIKVNSSIFLRQIGS